MRAYPWMKLLVLVTVMCAAGWATYAAPRQSSQQGQDDPVADAARKAREEKKNAPKPKKVYTDDDVRGAAPDKASAATSGTSGEAKTASADAGQKPGAGDDAKEDPNSEKAWRKRFQQQHDKIAKAEKELDVLQREQEKAQVQYYPDPQKAMIQQNTRADINTLLAKIDAKKQEIAQLNQGLDDMERDLRKAGGDPGWAR